MLRRYAIIMALSAAMAVALIAGKVWADRMTVAAQGAKSASVKIEMGGPELTISGGANGLMDGDFNSNSRAQPEIKYRVNKGKGALTVKHESSGAIAKRIGNRWNIALNNKIPLDLDVEFSTGKCVLSLAGLLLNELELEVFSGNAQVDLSGAHPSLTSAVIEMDNGELNVKMTGEYPALETLKVNLTNGGLTVDLNGTWTRDLKASFSSYAAGVTVILPKNIGVQVEVHNSNGRVNANGLTILNGDYVNEAFGKSSVTLRLEIRDTNGVINLQLAQ